MNLDDDAIASLTSQVYAEGIKAGVALAQKGEKPPPLSIHFDPRPPKAEEPKK